MEPVDQMAAHNVLDYGAPVRAESKSLSRLSTRLSTRSDRSESQVNPFLLQQILDILLP